VKLSNCARRHDQQKEGKDARLDRKRAERDLLVAEHACDADHSAVKDGEREQRLRNSSRGSLRLLRRGLNLSRHGRQA